jgi:hypothetical protein
VRPLWRHRDLAQSTVGRAQEPLDKVRIGGAEKGRIVRAAVLAGQEWALEMDTKDGGISPSLGRSYLDLGDQSLGGGRDQGEQLTSSAVQAVESPGRTDGLSALAVRGAGTAVVVDVEQPWGEDMACAVEKLCVISGEVTPAAAGPRGEDAIASEGDEGVGAVKT